MNEQAYRGYLRGLGDGVLVNWLRILRTAPLTYDGVKVSRRLIARELRGRGYGVREDAA